MWYLQKNRQVNQWHRIEGPEIGLHEYSQLTFYQGTKEIQWRKRVFFTMEQLNIHSKKANLDTDLIASTKSNLKWTTDLNTKYKTIKLLQDSIEDNLHDLGFDSDFLATTPKAQSMTESINKLT